MSAETEDERFERLSRDRIVRPRPKRFYKSVGVTERLEIALDGRIVKTPLKVPLVLPTRALADAVAAEWDAQKEYINPGAMPLTKLANTAIDRATRERPGITAEIMEFVGSDMVCYRLDKPASLVFLQNQHWDPVITWAKEVLDAKFATVNSIKHISQSAATIQAVARHVDGLDGFTFTAVHNLTTLTGSALLALMVAAGDIQQEKAWLAANVDEDWQIATWGKDDEAEVRRAGRLNELSACVTFINLAQGRP
jgi:chaperone required for assembly of F1-ATPase